MAVLLASSGCIHYQPRPIDPLSALATFEARTLDSPELGRFLQIHEATEWPPRAWGVSALALVALYYHPDLDVARSSWAAARAAVATAGERPNPNASSAVGYNSTTPANQITPWIFSLDLDFTVETAGKRGRRIAAAQQMSEAARLNIASAAWKVRSRVRRALLDLFAATRRAALLQEQHDIQQANVRLLERQLAAGAISSFELTQARLVLDGVSFALADAERQKAESRVLLAGALGVTVHALDGVTLSFESFERVPDDLPAASVRRQALLSRPDVLGALAQYEASQAVLQLEIARQYPDIHLGPGYQMDQTDDKWTLGLAGLLPIFNRNRGPIAEAEARRAEAAGRFATIQSTAIEEIDVALAGYQSARVKTATADALLVDLRKQEETAQARWRAGDISRLDLGSLQLESASAELARLEALIKAQDAVGRLEDAMQTPADLPDWVMCTPRATAPAAGNPR